MSFLKVSGKMDGTTEFSVFFVTYFSTGYFFYIVFLIKWYFDIRIIKNCIIWMFWRLGTMLKRFFIATSSRLHISKPKQIPWNIFFDISKVRKSSRRDLLGRQNSPTHRRVLTMLRGEGLPSPRSPPSALGLPPSDFLSKPTFSRFCTL